MSPKDEDAHKSGVDDVCKTLVESIHGYFYEVRYSKGAVVGMYHSPQCESITGYAPDAYAKDHDLWAKMIYDQDRDRVLSFFNNLNACGLRNAIEHRLVRRDSKLIWVMNQFVVLCDKAGRPVRLDGLILDITDRKLSEEALSKAKEEADEANRLKDRFLSLVIHDLKSPISSIKGYIEMLRTQETSQEMTQTFLNEAHESCDHMIKMIHELLSMNRIKNGSLSPACHFHDHSVLAEQAVRNARLHADNKGVVLRNNIPKGRRIYADDKLYLEVLNNLVSNAIKFSKKGDEVTLYLADGKSSTLAVGDTGAGMQAEALSKLFSLDMRSMPGTAGEIGTGLGLLLCHDIITAHGGNIFVKSAINEGSTFYVSLPEKIPVVMVVDDEPLLLSSLSEIISQMGVDVVTYSDPCEALCAVDEKMPHLILLDIIMPVMDGIELLRMLKQKRHTRNIPVIVITADGSADTHQSALHEGADDFMRKPVSDQELIPRIRRFIG